MKNVSPMSNSPPTLTQAEWEELWRKLRLHTWKRFRWLHEQTGEDLDAIAQQAMVDTLTGRRRWPPVDRLTGRENNNVPLFAFLCETVRSLISHAWEREKARISFDARTADSINDQEFIEKLFGRAYERNSFYVTPHKIEELVDYNKLTQVILKLVEDDRELVSIIRLWSSDPDLKPSEIAATLKLTMRQMRAAQKRLYRRLRDWKRRNEQQNR